MALQTAFDRRWITRPRSKKPIGLPRDLVKSIEAEDNAVVISRPKIRQLLGTDDGSQSGTYKQMHSTPMVTMNPAEVYQYFDIVSEGVPSACLHRIDAELTRSGLFYTRGDADISPTPEMQWYIDSVLKPMQYKALEAICAIGVVPIAFMRDEVTDMVIPYVPHRKTYTISAGTVRGRLQLRFHWIYSHNPTQIIAQQQGKRPSPNDPLGFEHVPGQRTFGSPDDSVIVLGGFNHDPDIDGKINSPVAAFVRRDTSAFFLRTAKIAEIINCNPPIQSQYDGGNDNNDHEKQRNSEFVGDGLLDQTAKNDADRVNRKYLRNVREIAAYMQQDKEIASRMSQLSGQDLPDPTISVSATSHDHRSRSATDAHGNLMPWANQIKQPEGYKHVPIQLPHPRSDLVSILQHNQTDVFMAFLIPPQSILANATLSADAQTAKDAMDIVASVWRKHLSRVLTTANDATYLEADMQAAFEEAIQRKKKAKDEPSRTDKLRLNVDDKDLEEIVQAVGTVRVHYATKPKEDLATLMLLLARGVFDWDTFVARVGQLFDIEPSQLSQKDPLPVEARRMIGMQDYATYMQIVDARDRETNRSKEATTMLDHKRKEIDIKQYEAENADDDGPPPSTAKRAKKNKQ